MVGYRICQGQLRARTGVAQGEKGANRAIGMRLHSVLQRNLDVLLAHAGQFDPDNYVVVTLIKIERR